MLIAIFTLAVMAGFLNRASRQGNLELRKLDMRFKLFRLRDGLRHAVINGEVQYNRWAEYLDTTLTKTIDTLNEVNIWEALALLFSYRNNASLERAQKNLHSALALEDNRKTKEVFDQYESCLLHFLLIRHNVLVGAIKRAGEASIHAVVFVDRLLMRLYDLRDRVARLFSSVPETSTLLKYGS